MSKEITQCIIKHANDKYGEPVCCGHEMDLVDGCYICSICGFSEENI